MIRLTVSLLLISISAPALAQDHAHHHGTTQQSLPGHDDHGDRDMPMAQPDPHAGHEMQQDASDPHAGHEMPRDLSDPHAGHRMAPDGTMAHDMPAKADPPPPPRAFEGPEHAADLIYSEAAMARAREQLAEENGGFTTAMLLVERFELRSAGDEDAYLWDAQGWYGGDINKLIIKTEGEGELGGELEDAELQVLLGHAIGPWFDLQAGAKLDIEPETRPHLAVGIQGLAPYMFHVDATAFLSDRGDLTARIEGEYDQRITQRLILQPRAEIELSAQDIPERGTGAGLTKLETGIRLRYEFVREFAPYVGLGYEAAVGDTADYVRAEGEDPDGFAVVTGLRFWF